MSNDCVSQHGALIGELDYFTHEEHGVLDQDPYEKTNLAAANPDKVATLQQRANDFAKQAAKPLFLVEQMRIVMNNMRGEPVLPTEGVPGDPAMLGQDLLDEGDAVP